jgi:hypothetical protein
MTNEEFKFKMAEAKELKWFNEVTVNFIFDYVNYRRKIEGLTAIYEYLNQQIDGWNSVQTKVPDQLEHSKKYFSEIRAKIIQFVSDNVNSHADALNNYWSRVRSEIERVHNKPMPYNIPETEFLLKTCSQAPDLFLGAYNFTLDNHLEIRSRESLFGAVLAYEFFQKEKSEITERRKAEESSLSALRSDFEKYLSSSERVVVGHIKNTSEKYDEFVKRIDAIKDEKEELFNSWFEDTKTNKWQSWYAPALAKVDELEKTYREKLKLEEPAKYWSERAEKLRKQGGNTMTLIIVLVIITAISLAKVLWSAPEVIYTSWFEDDKSAAIRWSVIYITLITLIAYTLRMLTKYMFSSFHIARDCEERHTLTYFYLSLLKDSSVDEKDRQLIMQSLFSRAETGLLKDDSSPTMPSDSIGKILSR